MDLERRLQKLESDLERGYRHLEHVLVSQRGIVQKAFDQVNLALLEQQVAIAHHGESTRSGLLELADLYRGTSGELDLLRRETEELRRRVERLENPPAA